MSRPGETTKRPSAGKTGKFSNPLSNWLYARKERRNEIANQAARMITNKIEDNATKLVDQLSSVDFIHSRLPKEVLEDRRKPDLPYCRLEYATKGLIQMIQNDRQNITVDIRAIDERLMTLVLMFKQFVDHGDATAAEMAKTALHRGVWEIRCRIPQNQPKLAVQFVQTNAEYLDQWIQLVEWAQIYDRQNKTLHDKRISHENDENRLSATIDAFKARLLEDTKFRAAFEYILAHDTRAERAKWTKEQREVHVSMIDDKMTQLTLSMSGLSLTALDTKQIGTKQKIDTLWKQLEEIPIVSDPNLMNKYRESMDKFIHDLTASDAFIEETINLVDELEGSLKQLEETPGAIIAKEIALNAAQRVYQEILKRQENQSGQDELEHKRRLKELGIMSDEELEIQRQQNQEKIDQLMEEAARNVQNQGSKNYN